MKSLIFLFNALLLITPVFGQSPEANKEIARRFYQDLWFSNHTDQYSRYVADEYRVHDIGDRKNAKEPAVRQKEIADFFWDNGKFKGQIDFQVAEGDLVATRWTSTFYPETLFGRLFIGNTTIPIINVFRLKNGKIVEIWNHRHDIDTPQTLKFVGQGFLLGILLAMIPTYFAIRERRKRQALQKTMINQ